MKLYFRTFGNGTPIIILHGLFGMSDNWIPVAKILAEGNKVFLPDLRNHGKSPHSSVHTYQSMSSDIYEFMQDNSLEKAILIGHSMGGKTVLQFVSDFPDKAEKYIIIDVSPKLFFDKNYVSELFHEELLKKLIDIKIQLMRNRTDLSHHIQSEFKDKFIQNLIEKNVTKDNENKLKWKLNLSALHANLNNLFEDIELSENHRNIDTLFIFGSLSAYYNNSVLNYLKQELPEVQIKKIEGGNHYLHVNKIDELTNEIQEFLNH